MTEILMPKATAVWLVDNTALTFEQIADFCGLHRLEVKGIADGDVAVGVRGSDPVSNGQLTREEIAKAEADADYRMTAVKHRYDDLHQPRKKRGPRYTPLSRRQSRPDAIAWLVRNHPELTDAQISKLIGTTKTTIEAVRERTHWNSSNIKPTDPVTLGLTTQIDLDEQVRKASSRREKLEEERKASGQDPIAGPADAEPEEHETATSMDEVNLETLFGGGKKSQSDDDDK
ncbi:DUF1013 domain-containing protein [Hyphobacterium indicum]|jgi:hypothetical protein|uniref:DUF1013 domain-containing protein n=1 Tax=Hyphobacterium indicum TaxID=2162714 RepID=UPI000D65EEC3|nr:cell cycle transcriptional regulator TrcR [Hyphobacterium indicum]